MFKTFVIFLILLLSGCGTTPVFYKSKNMPVSEAYKVIDQMVMTQHRNWKPDYFIITDRYLGWDYGSTSHGQTNAVVYNGFMTGTSSSTIRNVNERIYFNQIAHVQLLDWTRKFKQWYVVTLVDQNGDYIKHILRTRSKSDAKLMIDALTAVLSDRK
ncbi:hypothetical protein [Aliivibrio fischeri]|uniref:hypothetical protein n=1 Tax=Aliivibrio fischeri TaxID=668 RepID=UPI00084C5E97|nr:hypothetical protein [Aliivibrio fischeri]OED51068.1 hypothetical protein BEI47_10515 [Aliivibrio fischeri]